MMHFCTYFDINYIHKGLALYRSLERSAGQFTLWILCLDARTEEVLRQLELQHARLISMADFENSDPELLASKVTRTAVEYFWTCSPCLPLYILSRHAEVDLITYADSDMALFSSPQTIIEELGSGSIMMMPHDCLPEQAAVAGIYNVGVLTFRNDANGLACLRWWRERCIEWCYHRSEGGKWGDQAYLNEWPTQFKGVVVSQHVGLRAAPWNARNYGFSIGNRGEVQVAGQPLVFYHFHGIRFMNAWFTHLYGWQHPLPRLCAQKVYVPYVASLRQIEAELRRAGCCLPIPRSGSMVRFLAGRLLRRQPIRSVLIGQDYLCV